MGGRADLRMLGQMTKVQRSTLQEVQAKIQELRELSKKRMEQKQYDFDQRIKELRDFEDGNRKEKRERKKVQKEKKQEQEKQTQQEGVDQDMAAMMGFSGFS